MVNALNGTIIFLHIPKTGGTSLQQILLRKYSRDDVLVNAHKLMKDVAQWPEEKKRKLRYLQGHFIYGAHRSLPQSCEYITMLRDPVDRVLSHYYFLKRNVRHPLHKLLVEKNMGIEEYLTSGVCDEVRNDQARMVAGAARSSNMPDDEMADLAIEHLNSRFILVGLMEQFDESLLLLRKKLALKNVFYGVRNKTIGRPLKTQVSNEILRLIEERNALDIQLYNAAAERLRAEMHAAGPSFPNEVRRFRRLNRPYSDVFNMARTVKNRLFGSR